MRVRRTVLVGLLAALALLATGCTGLFLEPVMRW